ncbi:uncharacterized protein LOC108859363 isoform X3 [Raphanus sativus]|uniref:Uncharacterized protein LOC108859363 isoform X3 n=1 Tax=Raphanus sativus TaxID=3726 RepID=A0A9W3DUB6_RAPSA|nr:uncharacterized protein LOC108859363 isoform X3 [Raphanus sativus]
MFAARVLRASIKPLLQGRHSSSLIRNRGRVFTGEVVSISRRVVLDDDSGDGLRFTGNRERTKLFNREVHSSSTQCYSSESDVGVKTHTTMDDLFSELGSVQKDMDHNVVIKLLTKKPETSQVEKPELSQKTKGKKKINKKKKQGSDSVSKFKLLTEKPEASWKSNGKSKAETHASSPATSVTDTFSKPTESLFPIPDHESKAQSIISPGSEAKNETVSNVSSTSDTLSNHPTSVLVIRISNLNSKTTDSEIHSRCLSIGSLEGLARVSEDSVDVSFRATNMNEANSILKKLNKATVDHSQWTAEIVPEAEEASIDQMGVKIGSSFEDMKNQLIMRQILVKDLETLVHTVVHLENHPMDREGN